VKRPLYHEMLSLKEKAFRLNSRKETNWLIVSLIGFQYLLNLLNSWRIWHLDLIGYDSHGQLKSSLRKNLNWYSPIRAWFVMVVRHGSHQEVKVHEVGLVMWTCRMTLASAYVLHCLSAMWSQLQRSKWSLRWRWVLIWCVAIEHWRLSSIRIIFVDYQTSKLQCNY